MPRYVKIWNKEGRLHYISSRYKFMTDLSFGLKGESNYDLSEFEMQIEAICISGWSKNYRPPKDRVVLDGGTWIVKYKESGKEIIRRSGENAWPENWGNFGTLLKSVTDERI